MLYRSFVGGLITCLTFLTGTSFSASISINSTCEVGTCTTSDLLTPGASTTSPFSFVFALPNTDRYQATGTIGAINNFLPLPVGGIIQINAANIALTYLGNNAGTVSADDTLSIDFLQYFQTLGASGTNSSGFESITGNFSGAYAGASNVAGQAISTGGTAQALMGPFFPPNSFSDSRTNQPFSFASTSLLDFRDTVVFGAGSGTGATINVNNVSAAPEPETWFLSGIALFLLPFLKRMRP